MRQLIIWMLLLLWPLAIKAHDGHDHGSGIERIEGTGNTTENTSEKYEVLIKFHFDENQSKSTMTLYLSNKETNEPIDAKVKVKIGENKDRMELKYIGKGVYEQSFKTPDSMYQILVEIEGGLGNDLIGLTGVLPEKLIKANLDNGNWKWGIIGFIIGFLFLLFFRVLSKRIKAWLLLGVFIFSEAGVGVVWAHEGHDHGAEISQEQGKGEKLVVPKNLQFKLGIRTQRGGVKQLGRRQKWIGRVVPGEQGVQTIKSLFESKIVSIHVRAGEKVQVGQTLMILEKQGDFASENEYRVALMQAKEEWAQAEKNLVRLRNMGSAASRQELEEAETRRNVLKGQWEILHHNTANRVEIKSAISGIVNAFNLTPGLFINAGEELMQVMDRNNALIEILVTAEIESNLKEGDEVGVTVLGKKYKGKILPMLPTLGTDILAKKIRIEVEGSQLLIGEKAEITTYNQENEQEALAEIYGKEVAFIKVSAEQFKVVYETTELNKEQLVVSSGNHYLKLIYQKQ